MKSVHLCLLKTFDSLIGQVDIEDEGTVARSRAGKTVRNRSVWGHSRVFSSDEEDARTTKSRRTGHGGKSMASAKTKPSKVCHLFYD